LRTTTLSPPELCLAAEPPFPTSSFLIGNHADELTPWLPLLVAKTPGSAFLNIPCCCHRFTSRFTDAQYSIATDVLKWPGIQTDMDRYEGLARDKGGRYNAYLHYVAEQTIRAGWRPEREALRIPSTKCWAFVGRKRIFSPDSNEDGSIQEWIRATSESSLKSWQPRKPECGPDH
jgi:tRNASer (uridine44-2'-O)-methyltransferase